MIEEGHGKRSTPILEHLRDRLTWSKGGKLFGENTGAPGKTSFKFHSLWTLLSGSPRLATLRADP
jgi:hypothetical protein